MKTYVVKKGDVDRKWYVVDAENAILGRMATRVATVLMGKHKPTYSPHIDNGDFVIVINADKVRVTGKKELQKTYFRHTQYPGGGKHTAYKDMKEKHPERIVEHAVKGMLPKNKLGKAQYRKLKVYVGPGHPHEAQQPEKLEI
ncbi:MAG: 50S ribosomal protein L13 [bacterium]|jgi:large subunit ribosomal protein L13|nr:50S ribosomal protein L13 [bacterium]